MKNKVRNEIKEEVKLEDTVESKITNKKKEKSFKFDKKRITIISVLFLLVIIASAVGGLYIRQQNLDAKAKAEREEKLEKQKQTLIANITANYSEIVYTNKETDLYTKDGNKYVKNGKVGANVKLTLETIKKITEKNEYIKITNIEGEYYINYKDITPKEIQYDENGNEIKEELVYRGMGSLSLRYKNYIPFNENLITKETYSIYDTEDNFLYQINGSIERPIIIKKSDKYYFEYFDSLVYVKTEDVEKVENHNNTDQTPTNEMPVLLYHFFYDENKPDEVYDCTSTNAIICTSVGEFRTHLDYIKNNGFFTVNMDEFEMFIDGELRLPDKTVLITMDDGWFNGGGVTTLTEYGLNGTVFLISSAYEPDWFQTNYVEIHSHSHDLHTNWQCPTSSSLYSESQGGALLCYDEQTILNDLKASRDKVYNTHVFCYPFFDYNERAINLLKQAGFTMAFLGGNQTAKVGQDKMTIPRISIVSTYTVDDLARVLNY